MSNFDCLNFCTGFLKKKKKKGTGILHHGKNQEDQSVIKT